MSMRHCLDMTRRVGLRIATLCLLGSVSVALAAELAVTDDVASRQGSIPTSDAASAAMRAKALRAYAKVPLYFEMNAGQFDGTVRFGAHGRGYQLRLTGNETILVLQKPAAIPTDPEGPPRWFGRTHERVAGGTNGTIQPPTVIGMSFRGANLNPEVAGEDLLPGRSHYFIGSDPAKWHTNIAQYGRVRYRGVYPGIDLVYYGSQGRLEYDWIVAPGADPHQIVEAFSGATSLSIDADGDLAIDSPDMGIRQKKPVIYQEVGGSRVAVNGEYVLLGDKLVGFKVGRYDATLPLVIDPVLEYSTSLGFYRGVGVAASQTGEVYVVGGTGDTPSGFAIVTKINAAGDGVVYSTEFGGTAPNRYGGSGGNTAASKVVVGEDGSAYVLGSTQPSDFPATTWFGSHSTDPFANATFVVKLAPDGSALTYAALFGSILQTPNGSTPFVNPGGIAVDSSGSAYIDGWTDAPDFPTTPGALQSSNPSTTAQFTQFIESGFVTKLAPTGDALVYSTLFTDGQYQSAYDFNGVAIDSGGNAYVVGDTTSPNLPVVNAFQGAFVGGRDAYFAKLDPAGASLLYASYLGGSLGQSLAAAKVDSQGNLFTCGWTNSTDFPLVNPLPIGTLGSSVAIVAKVDPSGTVTLSTPLGSHSYCADLALDPLGNVFVTGSTDTTQPFPLVGDLGLGGAGYDAFLSKISADGTALLFSTVIGGSGYDEPTGVATDAIGGTYVAGYASTGFPITNSLPASGSGAFVLKVLDSSQPVVVFSSSNPVTSGQPVTFTAYVTSPNATGSVTFLDGTTTLGTVPLSANRTATLTVSTLSVGTHSITATYSGDANNASASATLTQVVSPPPQDTVTTLATSSTSLPANQTLTLTVAVSGSGGTTPTGQVTFFDGSTALGSAALASGAASFVASGLSGGDHSMTAQYGGDPQSKPSVSTPVSVTVIGPPTVSITSPAANSVFPYPSTVGIAADASAPAGATVVEVDFLLGGNSLGSVMTAPYTFAWANGPPGVYQLTARAVDNFGQTSVSAAVQVQISTTGTTYYHQDLQGNVIAASDGSGQVVYAESYLPFGARQVDDPASPVAQANGNRLWFQGKAQDEATGLSYFGARYYDPVIGRFMGMDSIGFDENNPHSFNRYAYGNNNPYRYTDPDGRMTLAEFAAVGIVLYLGATYYAHCPTCQKNLDDLGRWLSGISHNEAQEPNEAPGDNGKSQHPEGEGSGSGENTNPYQGPVDKPVIVVDPNGNAIPVAPGEKITSSPNGDYQQVRNSKGVQTGVQLDRGGHRKQKDPRAQGPHAHVPNITTSDGNPHLPIKPPSSE